MNKRKKNILAIVAILIILILSVGVFLLRDKKPTTEEKPTITEQTGEFAIKTEQDAVEEPGASDTFSDKTTNQNQTTDAGVKGKSGILDIITSENNKENNEDTENEELIWLPGIW